MSKKVSIIGGVLGGLFSLVPEAGRQITGNSRASNKNGHARSSGSNSHYHLHQHYKIGNTTKHEHVKKKDEYKFFTTHIHKKGR